MEPKETSQNNYMDRSVILFFIITIFVTATVFAYKYVNYVPCEIIDFEINAKNYRVGEIIRFKDNTNGVLKRRWSFGDSSKFKLDISPFHTYKKPGKYVVSLTVNDKCEAVKTIIIEDKAFILDSTKLANFTIPASIKVGEVLSVKDKTKGANKWEWRFGETADINSTKKNPQYTYKSSGLKTITLIVNGDTRYATRKKIEVLPLKDKPDVPIRRRIRDEPPPTRIKYAPENAEEAPEKEFKAPYIKDSDFKSKLIAVSKRKASAKDFSEYLCGNLQLPMTVKGRTTTFIEFCDKIKGKNIKIKEFEIFRNKKNNCIEYITIKYSKAGIF